MILKINKKLLMAAIFILSGENVWRREISLLPCFSSLYYQLRSLLFLKLLECSKGQTGSVLKKKWPRSPFSTHMRVIPYDKRNLMYRSLKTTVKTYIIQKTGDLDSFDCRQVIGARHMYHSCSDRRCFFLVLEYQEQGQFTLIAKKRSSNLISYKR